MRSTLLWFSVFWLFETKNKQNHVRLNRCRKQLFSPIHKTATENRKPHIMVLIILFWFWKSAHLFPLSSCPFISFYHLPSLSFSVTINRQGTHSTNDKSSERDGEGQKCCCWSTKRRRRTQVFNRNLFRFPEQSSAA